MTYATILRRVMNRESVVCVGVSAKGTKISKDYNLKKKKRSRWSLYKYTIDVLFVGHCVIKINKPGIYETTSRKAPDCNHSAVR